MIPSPTILLLGSGNVAWHLSAALSAKGCRFLGVYSRTVRHAKALAERLRCPVVEDLGRAPKDADVYLICTSDDAIAPVSALLPENDGLTVHVSGAAAIDVIDKKHRRRGVIYPLQTFNKNNSSLLRGCVKSEQQRHCEGDSPKQSSDNQRSGLLRYARNDGNAEFSHRLHRNPPIISKTVNLHTGFVISTSSITINCVFIISLNDVKRYF